MMGWPRIYPGWFEQCFPCVSGLIINEFTMKSNQGVIVFGRGNPQRLPVPAACPYENEAARSLRGMDNGQRQTPCMS